MRECVCGRGEDLTYLLIPCTDGHIGYPDMVHRLGLNQSGFGIGVGHVLGDAHLVVKGVTELELAVGVRSVDP